MVLTDKSNNQALSAADFESNSNVALRQTGKNAIRQAIDRAIDIEPSGGEFVEAYTDSNGRFDSVVAADTSSIFDTDKFTTPTDLPSGTEPYVVIEATSISAVSSFAINDCKIFNYASGKWVLYCTTGTDEVRRAQIYKTLFFDGQSGGARASSTYITGITALKTSVSRDIGKQAHYATSTTNNSGTGGLKYYTGTFANTSTNTDCSSWSNMSAGSTSLNTQWEIPEGTAVNVAPNSSSSNEIGTDTSADELDNPTDCQIQTYANSGNTWTGSAIVLCVGDITWVQSGQAVGSESNIDFLSDNGIPVFTDGSGETITDDATITHRIPAGRLSSSISSSFATVLHEDWEHSTNIQYKITASLNTLIGSSPYVIIEAGSVSDFSSFEINSCQIREMTSGKWVVYCTSGTDEQKRAKIYMTLFYGSDGSDAAILNVKGITALKTSVSRDIGKQAHYASLTAGNSSSGTYTGTFANTSTNTDCSSWSQLTEASSFSTTSTWELPDGTTLNTATGTSYNSQEMGTDLTADETDNPADCQLSVTNASTGSGRVRVLILCVGDISWATGGATPTASNIDYVTDYSIPLLTTASETFADSDTGWLETDEIVSFTAFTSEPSELQVKLIPKASSPTPGFPSVKGVAVFE